MKRKWGQHFLASSETALRIVQAAQIACQDIVLEIGPGHGELTRHYIERPAKIFLIEIDPFLCARLRQRWGSLDGRLTIINQDIREVDWARLALPKAPIVLGNLPYYVSKPILSWLIEWGKFDRAVLMLQEEVCERLTAQPGESAYSLFSVLFALRARGEILMTVKPEDFLPRPRVTSAVMRIYPKETPPADTGSLERLLKAAFSSRRQKLVNSLARGLPKTPKADIGNAVSSSGIALSARPQEVSGEQYLRLLEKFLNFHGPAKTIWYNKNEREVL